MVGSVCFCIDIFHNSLNSTLLVLTKWLVKKRGTSTLTSKLYLPNEKEKYKGHTEAL